MIIYKNKAKAKSYYIKTERGIYYERRTIRRNQRTY